MKDHTNVLDEALGVLDPVEQELKGANRKVIVKGHQITLRMLTQTTNTREKTFIIW